MNLQTIGFTKKSAREFFSILRESDVKRVVDVRLNNISQLSGFAKRDDLEFFLREVCGIAYVHLDELAPTKTMLDNYRKGRIDWGSYESSYLRLLSERRVEHKIARDLLVDACLLCSEEKAHKCHRRLAAEYLQEHWDHVEIRHLG